MTDISHAELIKPPRSQWRDVWDQFKSHKGAMAGAFVFIAIVAVVFLGPFSGRSRRRILISAPAIRDPVGHIPLVPINWGATPLPE